MSESLRVLWSKSLGVQGAGRPEEIAPRLKKLDRFMTTVLAVRGAEKATSIDLRWKGQVVVRWRSNEPSQSTPQPRT